MADPYVPLVTGFRATGFTKAFVLGAIFATIVAASAVEVRLRLEHSAQDWPTWKKAVVAGLVDFCVALVAYCSLYVLFGFGGGMLVDVQQSKL